MGGRTVRLPSLIRRLWIDRRTVPRRGCSAAAHAHSCGGYYYYVLAGSTEAARLNVRDWPAEHVAELAGGVGSQSIGHPHRGAPGYRPHCDAATARIATTAFTSAAATYIGGCHPHRMGGRSPHRRRPVPPHRRRPVPPTSATASAPHIGDGH